jgi:EAL domain-containing protein (putative c-di-GMP-specific phosphodiesterase class I)
MAVGVERQHQAPGPLTARETLDAHALRPVFQPVLDIQGGGAIGYESLIRGPTGSPLERPDLLFAAARREGLLAQLDAQCRRAAFEEAARHDLGHGTTLFVNVEPETLDSSSAEQLARAASLLPEGVQTVAEITERSLAAEPAALVRSVGELRRAGIGIALDDVGADDRSLALMPLLRPDVIKLDLQLVRDRPSVRMANILNAVSAQAERTGAAVVAEGIETEAQLEMARAAGATLAQGFLLGRPGPLPDRPPVPEPGLQLLGRSGHNERRTPFEVIQSARPARRATKALLRSISRALELQASALGSGAVVLATFQEARHFTDSVRATYTELAARMAFVGVLGAEMPARPTPYVRGGHLVEGDPVRSEWDVAVIGPHFAATLVARDLGDGGPDDDRRFDFIVSHNRDLAVEAARTLLRRIAGEREPASSATRAQLGLGVAG